MNDSDIIKALKQCTAGGSCRHCPLEDELGCRMKLLEFSLENINRQKADTVYMVYFPKLERDKAIKEFAAKLKNHKRKMSGADFGGEFWDEAVLVYDIDNLVKEMTEGTP